MWWTFGRSQSGLRVLIDNPSTTPAVGEPRRQAHRRRRADRAARLSPGPAPRENSERSSGRWRQATSWRSIRPLSPALAGDARQDVDDLAHLDVDAFLAQRRDGPVADPARHDVLAQVGHVGGDVEGEAVHRPAALEAHADGADLARVAAGGVDPHPRVLGEAAGADAERGERVDDHLFDVADVAGGVELVGDGEDRIADELAGTVVGDVAAAAHGDELGADVGGVAAQVVGEVRPRPVREHVRVLEEQQMLLGRGRGTAPPGPPAPRRRAHAPASAPATDCHGFTVPTER